MNLNNFEKYIDKKILLRGQNYYENGCVVSVEETDDNIFKAEVEGTELYTVEVELDDEGNIADTQCDCPYDMGEYCKHQAAVFLALRDMKNNISGRKSQMASQSQTSEAPEASVSRKRKTPGIREILDRRTKEELVEFMLRVAAEYDEIRQQIEWKFDNEKDEEEVSKSIALIRTFIRKNSDRYGFVNYGDADEAVRGAYLVLEKASIALKQNKMVHAVELALCVTQEMTDLLQYADDSDGVIGEVIDESLYFINEIIEDEDLSSVDKESIFGRLLEESTNNRYKGWPDWRLNFLEKCSWLAHTSDLRSKLEKHLLSISESAAGDTWTVNYLTERINLIRYNMVEEYDGQKKAQEFLEQNLQYSSFRKMAIETSMTNKEYDNVIKLALDGEEKDKSLPGLVDQWKRYRYKACQLSGKLDEQRGIATDFILDGSFEYYKELKKTYAAEEWSSVYPKIIFMLEDKKKTYMNIYTSILIEEGEKQKLLEYVKGTPSSVESYYKHLIPEFKEEVYAVFWQFIGQKAARAGNRRDYQQVCAVIRNLKKAGGKEQASEIRQTLYAQYANRPAFRDELSRV